MVYMKHFLPGGNRLFYDTNILTIALWHFIEHKPFDKEYNIYIIYKLIVCVIYI